MQPERTEATKINPFHAQFWKKALQTFQNINATNKKTLKNDLILFRRKYVKLDSRATAKHKWQKLTFDTNTKSFSDLLEVLNKYAKRAFGDQAQQMIDGSLYVKMPSHLKKSIITAYLENSTYEQIVAHLEKEFGK